MPKFDADLELLRTPHLYESDMLAEALEQAGIPYYRLQEDLGGVQTALVMPVQGGPGIRFLVIVPAAMESRARAILQKLPIQPAGDFGLYGFNSSARVKTGIRAVGWAVLVMLALMFLAQLGAIRHFLLRP